MSFRGRGHLLWFSLLLSAIISSCMSRTESTASLSGKGANNFSLKVYFDQEAAELNAKKVTVSKTIRVDGFSQTLERSSLDWKKEFGFFSSSDINKTAWRGKYAIDSNTYQLRYTALDSSLKVKLITVRYRSAIHSKSSIKSIQIQLFAQNFLYKLDEALLFCPDSLYSIHRVQKILLLGKKEYLIKGLIHQPPVLRASVQRAR